MGNRTRTIAVAAVVTALAGGSTAAVASTMGAKPAAAKNAAASAKPSGASSAADRQVHAAMTATVARNLHVTTARAAAALQPLYAAGHADTASPVFAAAARSLGVSAQQLNTALAQAKQSVAASMHIKPRAGGAKTSGSKGAKTSGSKTAEEQPGHAAMTAAVARNLHVTTARAAAALQPLFAAGDVDTASPAFAAAARSLGVSAQQLNTALAQAKQSLAVHG